MTKKLYYRITTSQQRRHLFEIWLETGSVAEACRRTHISRSTFYFWKKRFTEAGFPALEETRSHAPKNPSRIPSNIEKAIICIKRQNPQWGKAKIAKYLSRASNEITSLSPNTVRRVLIDAGLWD